MAPTPPVLEWLKWSGQDLERHIAKSGMIGAIIGINNMGDLQMVYSPIIIPNAFSSGNSAIIGNSSNVHTEPVFVYIDASYIGLIMAVVTYNNIPSDLHPEEHFSSRIVASIAWASAKVKFGVVHLSMVALLFFRQKTLETSVHNPNFEDPLKSISLTHFQWAQLMK